MEKVKKKIVDFYNDYKFMFVATIIIGLLTHMFILTNKLLSHDEIQCLYSKGLTFEIGRWGLELIKYIFPSFSMQWYNGIITLIVIALASCFVAKILNVNSKLKQCLIGGIMITYPSITCTLMYMFTANSYGVAILLAVLCVYFALKSEQKKVNILFSVICLVLSVSIYQAYISLAATLFILLLLKECINEKKSFKDIICKALKYVGILIVSLIIYLIVFKACNKFFNIAMTDYQGVNNLGNIGIRSILKGIRNAYRTIKELVITDFYGISANILLKIGFIILTSTSIIYAGIYLKNILKQDIKKTFLFILFVLLLPLSMNSMYILNPNVDMHSLIVYSNCLWLILPLFLSKEIKETKWVNYINKLVVVVLVVMIFKYITLANECYLKLKLSYENTYSFYNTLITRIESTEGFDKDTKIAFIGIYDGQVSIDNADYFIHLNSFTGLDSNLLLISTYSKNEFIRNYMGVNFQYATDEEIEKLVKREDVQEMDIYPYANSIRKIDNIIVIKFSDVNS